MPTCTPATSRSAWIRPPSGATSRWTSASSARSPSRQGIPGAELHRLLPARLQARGRAAHRKRLGAARHPRGRAGRRRAHVCEPYFDRPLKEISLGMVLMRLFQTSRRFNVEIQPQLVLLQKTLLNIEGLGRQLDPDLDLWSTAKPFLEKWMLEQVGMRGLWARIKREAPRYAKMLPELPRLIHHNLEHGDAKLRRDLAGACWPSSVRPTGCCQDDRLGRGGFRAGPADGTTCAQTARPGGHLRLPQALHCARLPPHSCFPGRST
jgi:hypothetical protein